MEETSHVLFLVRSLGLWRLQLGDLQVIALIAIRFMTPAMMFNKGYSLCVGLP